MNHHKKKEKEEKSKETQNNKRETESKEDKKNKEERKKEKKSSETDQNHKIRELTETLQRLQAEFENYKKRIEKEKQEFTRYANQELIKKILPVLDDFELALKNCKAKDDFYKGIQIIYSHLIDALQSQGLKPIEAQGKKFDPYYHEALLAEESDKEENTVLEEMQKGYMLHDKVIRHSKVKVAKPRRETESKEQQKAEKEGGNNKTLIN